MSVKWIGNHPQRDNEAVNYEQGAHQQYQLRVLKYFVLAQSDAAVRKNAVHPIRFGEH